MSDPKKVSAAPEALTIAGVARPRLGDRSFFPQLNSQAYLAHAAISPASAATVEMVKASVASVAERGVGSFPMWSGQRERLRRSAAMLLGVLPDDVALTAGCTRGITDLALSLPWASGDVLLGYRGEFPANVIPWQLAARRNRARVELLDLPDPTLSDCRDRILTELEQRFRMRDSPRWVAVSAVQFQTGLAMPLAEMTALCRAHRARLFVDGIQAAGVVPLDLTAIGVDAFFVGAHKWLLGIEGVGLGYYRPDLMEELLPVTAGWLSFPDAEAFLFRGSGNLRYDRELHPAPRVFEGSTASVVGFAALEAGVDTVRSLGVFNILKHVQSYHDQVEPGLVELGLRSLRATDPTLRSGILSFSVPEGVDVTVLSQNLRGRGVHVSIPDGLVRLAPHFANPLNEAGEVVAAFRQVLAESRVR